MTDVSKLARQRKTKWPCYDELLVRHTARAAIAHFSRPGLDDVIVSLHWGRRHRTPTSRRSTIR